MHQWNLKGKIISIPQRGKDKNNFYFHKTWIETNNRTKLPIYFWKVLLYSEELVGREKTGEDWIKVRDEIVKRGKDKIKNWKIGDEINIKGYYWTDETENNLTSFTIEEIE